MKNINEKKIRKGGLVKLNAHGVAHADRLTHGGKYEPAIWGKSKFTEADHRAYREEIQKQIAEAKAAGECAMHITMRDDGESRLPPTSVNVHIYPDRAYQVLRARCVGSWNYRRHPGQCLVLDLQTGREVYVPRNYVEAV
ncbi:MAG: hypothetical protein CMB77_03500 [Euryarchaeota archaeon]|mgnify:CR=1 FL=1|nr:hypothetical protein [Euryarchaeota archaeon]|tara:strand:- start:7256 stop:7675 length:420 start_codon:yes stop_codon:yes gene_type:complete